MISHKFLSPVYPVEAQTRPKPAFSTLLLRRILHRIDAKLVSDLPPPPSFTRGRTCELRLALTRSKSTPGLPPKSEGDVDLVATEPSLEQLSTFTESLKGKNVALYASSKGSFAQHFTSYLTAWGMDVNHVSPEGNVEGVTAATDALKPSEPQEAAETTKDDVSDRAPPSIRFIVIDDDVDILKECLYAMRNENQPYTAQRPSLVNAHRPQSSPSATRTGLLHASILVSPVVLHFTNLSNYKAAKDALQTVIASYSKLSIPAPDVMIIPKPVGPRRLLTALHTSITKPLIDPLFLPIATSPQSPGIFAHGAFFGSYGSTNAQASHRLPSKAAVSRPYGGRTNTDRSTRSPTNSDHSPLHPPSPLGAPDRVEYFSRAAYRLGGSPSSGLVIQSPDGQPAGIFFHPRLKSSSRTPSTHSMERDRGQPEHRSQSVGRATARPNHKGGPSQMPQAQSVPPVPTARASSTTGVPQAKPAKPIVRSQSGPGPEHASTSTTTVTNEVQAPTTAAPVKTDPVEVIVQAAPPPSSATTKTASTPTRRSVPRRKTADSNPPTGAGATSPSGKANGKKKISENPIVPPISVLIVDDNSINQTILSTFMKKKKIQYDIANNGLEAVEKWKTGAFHLILMDIQMPVMDGIEATKEIRRMEKTTAQALYPTTPTPSSESGYSPVRTPSDLLSPESRALHSPYHPSVIIVALTASSLQSDRVAALGAGCNDFLTKPVSLLWLNSKIIEWGSIKALQMWADLRPSVMRSISHGQQAQARNIAERLHVPKSRMNGLPAQAQASETTSTTGQPTRTSLSIQNDQTQNATGQAQYETKSGNIIGTSASNESQASSNKAAAGVMQGSADVSSTNGEDSGTHKVSSHLPSSFSAKSKVLELERKPCESLKTDSVSNSSDILRHNSDLQNGCATDETINHLQEVSSTHVS
ncbi:hypothetical protein AX15_003364 [Amanita polypyramis BW_CC]|nr:hypothetical protein AX15_003364 [Amanita polypyramis BW_CC]